MPHPILHLLVTFDAQYIPPFQTMLVSAVENTPGTSFHVWLLHSAIPRGELDRLGAFCRALGTEFTPLEVDRALFAGAPVSRQYPQEMYYRLLAPHLLPDSLHRVLYLDPDILVINSLTPLWDTDLQGNLFAAASHTTVSDLVNGINRIRLNTDQDYYNTGVLLMDLDQGREAIHPQELFHHVTEHQAELLLPDQDVFNALYGSRTLWLDDALWNYDARYFHGYFLRSSGTYTMDWVVEHTAILHFCGKRKPWKKAYSGRFSALYKHYAHRTRRAIGSQRTSSSMSQVGPAPENEGGCPCCY